MALSTYARSLLTRPGAPLPDPVRAEIFSAERLEEHGRSLASAQPVQRGKTRRSTFFPRVRENDAVLRDAYAWIGGQAEAQRALTPAAEWMLDNFYIVEEQIRDIRDNLPLGFYRQLPKLVTGPLAGLPRIFGIAWAFVAHTDSRFDAELLRRFVRAYQSVDTLTIGEIWALPTSIRVVMVENLRRVVERIVVTQIARDLADESFDAAHSATGLPSPAGVPFAELMPALEARELRDTFIAEIVQRMRRAPGAETRGGKALLEWVRSAPIDVDQVIRLEQTKQAASNVTVRNLITSMRAMSALSWREFFESVSPVDRMLADAPGFAEVDFGTRDRYRHAIEDLARISSRSELAVAYALRGKAATPHSDASASDIGYYLIGNGRAELESTLGVPRTRWYRLILRGFFRHAPGAYTGTIALITLIVVGLAAWPVWADATSSAAPVGWLIVAGLLALLPASDIALALIQRIVTESIPPRRLPRLALHEGIPDTLRTLVAVPTLLIRPEQIDAQVRRLELHFLANPEPHVQFALLTDWVDAPAEATPEDQPLLQHAIEAMHALNERHSNAPEAEPRFVLLHRPRTWDASEQRWIGWERKRGKLEMLNRHLLGSAGGSNGQDSNAFLRLPHRLSETTAGVKYVVPLDADTVLPPGSLRQLVGIAAHPIHRPVVDRALGRVVSGYAIFQPRVTPSLPAQQDATVYHALFAGPCGLDPYAAATSDVYQDLFAEGTFTGKGLYDVEAFHATLDGLVPDDTLLSHDLFEGSIARCAYVSDVDLVEEFLSNSEVASTRAHRWTRGDWQLLPWIVGLRHAPLSAVARWKMIDNLRRSLVAPAAVALLAVAWLGPQANALPWTLVVLASIVAGPLLNLLAGLPPARSGLAMRPYWAQRGVDVSMAVGVAAWNAIMLARHAWLMVDAIVRTLVRIGLTRRHLLEWTTAAQAKAAGSDRLSPFIAKHAPSVSFALIMAVAIAWAAPSVVPLAAGWVIAWISAPFLAWLASRQPDAEAPAELGEEDRRYLRRVARDTWRYFDRFVSAEENFLPPDNFQEDPEPKIASRGSPTNFGLYLLSVAAAREFGWIGLSEMQARLDATFGSMAKLARYRGHFYNWYDTRTMQELPPAYVSSVDSGNLAAHLLAVAAACDAQIARPLFDARARAGLDDVRGPLSNWLERKPSVQSTSAADKAASRDVSALERALEGATLSRLASNEVAERLDATRTALAGHRAKLPVLDDYLTTLSSHVDDARKLVAPIIASIERLDRRGESLTDEERAWLRLDSESLSLGSLPDLCDRLLAIESRFAAAGRVDDADHDAYSALVEAREAARSLGARLGEWARQARQVVHEMDFAFLFDPARELFSIGYRVPERELDGSHYDLLASEARLTSYLAIMKGEAPLRHWFQLGRVLVPSGTEAVLRSWSGSMFEYLMPALVMRSPAGSLLDQTCRRAVEEHERYGREHGIPWGISESAYNARDRSMNYQYQGFGVPRLGLKRGLERDRVVAPYATGLAAMFAPREALENFQALEQTGARGRYGFYEALDYTERRRREGEAVAVVRCYMAHHQGMTLVALANVLCDDAPRRWFHSLPAVRACDLLLQERAPRDIPMVPAKPDAAKENVARTEDMSAARRYEGAQCLRPATQLISNGRYTVMLTAAGTGASRWGDLAVTRWRDDATADWQGSFVFLRNIATQRKWSIGFQPTQAIPDESEVVFLEDRARFRRLDGDIESSMEVVVSPEDDVELRTIRLQNRGGRAATIEVSSYAEIVLAPQAADEMHPAFSNLFVRSEWAPELSALFFERRARSTDEHAAWAVHFAAVDSNLIRAAEFETDRARFIGRNRFIADPAALGPDRSPVGTVGATLDPIASLRVYVQVPAHGSAKLMFATAAARTRDELARIADKYRDLSLDERVSLLSWTHSQVQLRQLGVDGAEAREFQLLAAELIYTRPKSRVAGSKRIERATASTLWRLGISGDRPIVVVHISAIEGLTLVRSLLRAQEYWRFHGLAVDLVIVNREADSYLQEIQQPLENLASALRPGDGGVRSDMFLLRGRELLAPELETLQALARRVFFADGRSLAQQHRAHMGTGQHPSWPEAPPRGGSLLTGHDSPAFKVTQQLIAANGYGGFTPDGSEYCIDVVPGRSTPAPWINVIANRNFGFQVSESGAGFTWFENSRLNPLTPWSNDPVSDPAGEAFYFRDPESSEVWSPTSGVGQDDASLVRVRHGQGYSVFERHSHEIDSRLTQFVAPDDAVKLSMIELVNSSNRTRRIRLTGFVEWLLGTTRRTAPLIETEFDARLGAMFARNPASLNFPLSTAFLGMQSPAHALTGWSADRQAFFGTYGRIQAPAAIMTHAALNAGESPATFGLDPCAALQTEFSLAPGARTQVVFMLGAAPTAERAHQLADRYRSIDAGSVLAAAKHAWRETLDTIRVSTPDPRFDLMVNGWLLYQTLACRIWARAAFYQAGGAYGFRDQLQDVLALLYARPAEARAHILLAASRQFVEGDVQHWWHPPGGAGVRTRFSDDLLWLPFATARYIEVTGDRTILEERAPFLRGPAVPIDREDAYFEPEPSEESASVFEHCARALNARLHVGPHGLPPIGAGDWNDGMNRVGHLGIGESVWLGWFLVKVLNDFAALADATGETAQASAWRAHARDLTGAIEREGWDGEWYRRGYFDDGTPLGSQLNDECRIDLIAQTWSVLSEAGRTARTAQAMHAAENWLADADAKLIKLLTPPFDKTKLDPGYIKSYPPGVRENGGQYSHAGVWAVMALAAMGEGNRAYRFFEALSPAHRAATREAAVRYKLEPYAMAADVYSEPPHVGRGGWSWYTGSAGWMYRAAIESILGLQLRGDRLFIRPCVPDRWERFSVSYRHGATRYAIEVQNPSRVQHGVSSITVDDTSIPELDAGIQLVDDRQAHCVVVTLVSEPSERRSLRLSASVASQSAEAGG